MKSVLHSANHADLSYVYAASRAMAENVEGFSVVGTKLAVLVGTGDEGKRVAHELKPHAASAVVFNPEFLSKCSVKDDFKQSGCIVLGTSDPCTRPGEQDLPSAESRSSPADLHRTAPPNSSSSRPMRFRL